MPQTQKQLVAKLKKNSRKRDDKARHLVVCAYAGTGKCLGEGTPVMLHTGEIFPVEEIEAGDTLMGPESDPRKVLSVSRGRGPLYRVVPVKGDSWVCNDEHILTLAGTNNVYGQVRDISVKDYLRELEEGAPNCTSWKLLRARVDEFGQETTPEIPPYLVGIWMGDGTRGGSDITNNNPEIQNYCKEVAEDLGLNCRIVPDSRPEKNTCYIRFSGDGRKGNNPLRKFFRKFCRAGNLKSIPHNYLTANRQSRLELLAGILDTDSENTGNSHTSVCVTGEIYRDALLFLCRSLGLAAYCKGTKIHVKANGETSTYYGISISGDLDEVPNKIRKFPPRKQVKRVNVVGFELEPIGDGDYFGFTLDGDGRFLLGDFTVTHNTWTMIVGTAWAFGKSVWDKIVEVEGYEPTPSTEQQAIWDALAETPAKTVTYCAFNRSIVGEFSERWGYMQDLLKTADVDLQFSTVNGLGHRAVMSHFGRVKPGSWRTKNVLGELLGRDVRELERRDPILVAAIDKLVGLCKLTLAGWTETEGFDSESITDEDLDEIAGHYDIDLNGHRSRAYELTRQVLEKSLEVDGEIDWNDQNWLPVVLDLPVPKVDLVLIDESQDLSRCKQEFCRKAGRRIVCVGDQNQSLYGFAGADTESIPRMMNLLGVDEPLRLTETRRCGHAIVKDAGETLAKLHRMRGEAYSPFTAYAENAEGKVTQSTIDRYSDSLEDGDTVLCRVNAPLVSQALKLLKQGRKALIRGRNFGSSLIKFVEKLRAVDVGDLIVKAGDWAELELRKESKKKNPSEAKLIAIQDKVECIEAFAEGALEVSEVTDRITKIFKGKICPSCERYYDEEVERCSNKACKTEKDPVSGYPCGPRLVTPQGVVYSSIHRAKGTEADRVFLILKDAPIPHPMAKTRWQIEQDICCLYVAQSRARLELIYVH